MVDQDKTHLNQTADAQARRQAIRRQAYEIAREYWTAVGDQERLSLTDEELDEQFWLIDHEGIPRLISEKGKIDLPPHPLARLVGIADPPPEDKE